MRQLAFVFPRRFEIPAASYSWPGGSITIGAHSIDESWPWHRPAPWEGY